MATQDLLACMTEGATEYIQKAVNFKSKEDYKKLKKLFDQQQFEAKSFEDTDLNILTFDWHSLDRDRNWWWQLQALPFLNWYVNSLALQSDEESSLYFDMCLDAIRCWEDRAKRNEKSPLAWHDHATAFRVRNLVNWLVFCQVAEPLVCEKAYTEALDTLIMEHLDWLHEDKHYSKHTNHGFDQAMISLIIASMFSCQEFEAHRQLNRKRLEDEVKFAFTDEGVHKENSPGYQKMMLGRLKQLRTLAPLGEQKISQMGELYIKKAEAFLCAITLPNGFLPMIGDTRGGDEGLPYSSGNKVDVLDYSASGYVIIRGVVLEKDFHLIFKASHFSHYHRHDDDLSIHLYFDGEIILKDGGLGSHNEKDLKRISLRSGVSHNAPYISGVSAVRKVEELFEKNYPKISLENNVVVGFSGSYKNIIKRAIDLNRLDEGVIILSDSTNESVSKDLITNFYSTGELYRSKDCLFKFNDKENIFRIKPISAKFLDEKSVSFSEKFGVFSNAKSFSYILDDKEIKETGKNLIRFEISLSYKRKSIFEVNYRGYGPINITEGQVWFFDKDYPGNVCHHIMSLRWLDQVKSEELKQHIIKSFVAYHEIPNTKKSKYYLGKEADHTTSIRLTILLENLKRYSSNDELRPIIKKELLKNIRSCLKETYKENNNHGLMVDKALLECFINDKYLLKKVDSVRFVVDRVKKQIDAIFDQDGYSKEHSISYQEYNLGILVDLYQIMKKGFGLGFDSEIESLRFRLDVIKAASKKSLGYLLKSDGEYIPVGDSFPEPRKDIIAKAFNFEKISEALHPYATETGCFYNKTLGVAVFRSSNIHFVLNASWHSYVHKQNDDLSIFLRLNNEDVLIEGGYSDIIRQNVVDTRSEFLHSTIISNDNVWLKRNEVDDGFSDLEYADYNQEKGRFSTAASHTRIVNSTISRKVDIDDEAKTITIVDNCESNSEVFRHRFILNSSLNIKFTKEKILISSALNEIEIVSALGDYDTNCILGEIDVIRNRRIFKANYLDFFSKGEETFTIFFDKKR